METAPMLRNYNGGSNHGNVQTTTNAGDAPIRLSPRGVLTTILCNVMDEQTAIQLAEIQEKALVNYMKALPRPAHATRTTIGHVPKEDRLEWEHSVTAEESWY